MHTPQNFGSTHHAEPHTTSSVGGKHPSVLEGGEAEARGSLRSRVVERTLDQVGTYLRSVPAQLKANPLAVLGVGIGVGVAIGTLVSPFSRMFTQRSSLSGLMAYRKQIMRALGM